MESAYFNIKMFKLERDLPFLRKHDHALCFLAHFSIAMQGMLVDYFIPLLHGQVCCLHGSITPHTSPQVDHVWPCTG